MTTWTPKTQQAETWTSEGAQLRQFSPHGFSRTPNYSTGSVAGIWDERDKQDEVWTPE